MSVNEIGARSIAAETMREALDYAQWLQAESVGRGKELTWDAAVTAGVTVASNRLLMQCEEHLFAIGSLAVEDGLPLRRPGGRVNTFYVSASVDLDVVQDELARWGLRPRRAGDTVVVQGVSAYQLEAALERFHPATVSAVMVQRGEVA